MPWVLILLIIVSTITINYLVSVLISTYAVFVRLIVLAYQASQFTGKMRSYSGQI